MSVETSFLVAIAVLACVVGVEIAGIAILISKMRHARSEQVTREDEGGDEYGSGTGSQLAVTALMFGAVPMAAQIALFALAVCAAVGAGVFVLLLVVYRAHGYALAARVKRAEKPVAVSEEAPEAVVDERPVADVVLDDDTQETYIEELFAKEPEEAVEETVEETVEEKVEEVPAEPVEEAPRADEPVAVVRREETAAAAPSGVPVYSSAYPAGQVPVIEKHITETYREVIKETNTTTTTTAGGEQQYSPATEEILKAIAELMKLGTQLRMEKEMVVENPVLNADDSTPAFAEIEEDEPEVDEIEEDDEIDEVDAEGSEAREDDERDGGDDEYDSDLFGNGERIVGFDEETGCYIVARYRKSFEAKLIQARPEVKKYYSEIKNALLSYEGNKDRISWTINSYSNEHTQIAKINVRNRTLDLYLALDPATLEDSAYHGRDVGDKKKYAETPFLFKVNSQRKLTLALELVQRTCEEQGLSPIDIEAVNYEEQYPFESTEGLVRRGLIREYLREEKPAATFELAPDHAPELPEEDGSVIPANANFTWELADEQPVEEPVVEEEPVIEEPVIEEEPIAEEPEVVVTSTPTSTTVTTSHETVKTTERHYTERYVGGMPTQQTEYTAELTESTPPVAVIEAVAEPAEETPADEPVVDEPIVEEPVEETVEEAPAAEVEEIYEEEPEAETEEIYEEEPEVEAEEYYEEEPEAETEEYYEEEPEVETEEYYEEEPEVEAEEYYEEEPEVEAEDEYEEVDVEDEEYYEEADAENAEYYEEEPEAEDEEVEEAPAPAPAPVAPAEDPSIARLDVCSFDGYFDNGAIVNLETLKQVGLAPESATTLKLFASGPIKGQYTVEANHFTIDAVRAIRDADGESFVIR